MPTPVKVKAINSSLLLVAIGDGASPEVFTHPCMINTSRGIVFSASPLETLVPFCPPDEDLPGWVERETDSLSAEISGAGVFDAVKSAIANFWNWFETGESKNVRVIVNKETNDVGWFEGKAILSSFTVNGPGRRERVTFDCTILSDGPWDWVPATP